jgi:hypothetical protein
MPSVLPESATIEWNAYERLQWKNPPRQIRIGEDFLVIALACIPCMGKGWYRVEIDDAEPCPDCEGTGYRLTPDGRNLREWLR